MHSHMPACSQVILRDVRRRSLAALPGGLQAYGLAQGLCVAAMHIALMVLSALACTFVYARNSPLGVVLYVITLFFLGSRMRALGNVLHETAHGTYFRERRHNEVLGRMLALIDFQSFDRYVAEHRSHHAHLGVPARDLDLESRRAFGFEPSAPRPFLRHILGALTLRHLPRYVQPCLRVSGEGAFWAALRLAWPCFIGFFLWKVSFWGTLLFGIVPFLTTYQMFRYWSDALDHAGLLEARDAFFRARNHLTPWRAMDVFLFPRNDGYHLAHHVLPTVPARHLPRVHEETLLQDPIYAAREHTLRLGDAAFAPAGAQEGTHRALGASQGVRPCGERFADT